MTYILFRYLHFFAIFVMAGAVVIENMAIKPQITGEDARNLAKVDAVYGIAAGLVAGIGIILWQWVGKPSDFYSYNPVFLAKIILFIIVALMSIYPTVFFFKHRKSTSESIVVPRLLTRLLRTEIVLLCMIPVLAVLMTRGVGL